MADRSLRPGTLAGSLLAVLASTAPSRAQAPTPTDVATAAATTAGLEFTTAELELMVGKVRQNLRSFARLRAYDLPNAVPPALAFRPLGPARARHPLVDLAEVELPTDVERPADLEDLAFADLRTLAALIKNRKVSCLELTRLFLDRLERLDETLECVVTRTTERAETRAAELDAMLERGEWLGPLHGIPYGAKDLLAARGYPTTWGAAPYRDQVLDDDAAVIANLDAAGAVLVAKLTLGALAWGDVWFGGKTRSPWNPERGSSGSSAGSASATAAGAVPFAIGSETLGSIVSPSVVCGCSSLRPTFGVVDTTGAMALSWSMDKLGPICRSLDDAELVFTAMLGDAARTAFGYAADSPPTARIDVTKLRVGYLKAAFAGSRADPTVLDEVRALGVDLVPVELPDYPVRSMTFVLNCEGAAAFDALTRSNRDDELVRQIENAWPNVFRAHRLVPAVEYIQAQRLRTLLMRDTERALAHVDVYVHPTHTGLALTNLTGHPQVVCPRGKRRDGSPGAIGFTGRMYGEAALLALARAWQNHTKQHLDRPKIR